MEFVENVLDGFSGFADYFTRLIPSDMLSILAVFIVGMLGFAIWRAW